MRLATLRNGRPDTELVVDGGAARFLRAREIAPPLRAALEVEPALRTVCSSSDRTQGNAA